MILRLGHCERCCSSHARKDVSFTGNLLSFGYKPGHELLGGMTILFSVFIETVLMYIPPNNVYEFFCCFLKRCVYLKGKIRRGDGERKRGKGLMRGRWREGEREKERENMSESSISWFTSQMFAKADTGPGWTRNQGSTCSKKVLTNTSCFCFIFKSKVASFCVWDSLCCVPSRLVMLFYSLAFFPP